MAEILKNFFFLSIIYMVLVNIIKFIINNYVYASQTVGFLTSMIIALILGYLYSSNYKWAMDTLLKFKITLTIVIINVIITSFMVFLLYNQNFDLITISVVYFFILVESLVVYPFLTLGSKLYLKGRA